MIKSSQQWPAAMISQKSHWQTERDVEEQKKTSLDPNFDAITTQNPQNPNPGAQGRNHPILHEKTEFWELTRYPEDMKNNEKPLCFIVFPPPKNQETMEKLFFL